MRVLPLALIGGVSATLTGNAALTKVVEMLKDMKQKAQDEGQVEKVQFEKFATFMSTQITNAKQDIATLSGEIEAATANRNKAKADKEEATAVAAEKTKLIADLKADLNAAKKTRTETAENFMKDSTELQDGIYACEQAIKGLSAVSKDTEAVAAFAQLRASKGPKALMNLLETLESDPYVAAHSADAARTVIDMIEKLKEEFDTALQKFTKEENDSKHDHAMMVDSTNQEITGAEKALASAEKTAADSAQLEGEEEAKRQEAAKNKKATEKVLKDTETELASKQSDFDARSKSRAEEQTALDSAISALESTAMSAGAGQLDSAQAVGAFLQLKSDSPNQARVLEFLRSRGATLGSKMLVQIAEAASADPFAKVKDMITQLVNRLEEEALAEQSKHAACKKDMARDKANIESATAKKEDETAKRDKAQSNVEKLTQKIKEQTDKINALTEARREAVEMRAAEKAENDKAIKEGDAGLVALGQAKTVLQDYYSKVNAAFVQQPEYAGGEYKGVGGEGGVLGLLDVLEQDMTKMVEETTAAESKSASDHTEFLNDTDTEVSNTESAQRTAKENLATQKQKLTEAKENLVAAETELASHMELKKNTDKRCISQGASAEENAEKRDAEIASLKEALTILEGIEI